MKPRDKWFWFLVGVFFCSQILAGTVLAKIVYWAALSAIVGFILSEKTKK